MSLSLLATMMAIKTKLISNLNNTFFYSITVLVYLLTRIIFTIILFTVFDRQGPGDLLDVFYPQALSVKQGSLVYNDFYSSYSILFPYLLSVPLYLWDHALSIAIFFVIIEFAVLIVSLKYILPEFDIKSKEFVWFFVFCPINVVFTVYYIQDEIIISLFLVLAFILIIRKKRLGATIVLILGFFFTKLIVIYFFIPLLFVEDKKYLFLFIIGLIIPNFVLYVFGINIFIPLQEGTSQAVGPNIWTLLEYIGIIADNKIVYSILLIITGGLIGMQLKIQKMKNKFEVNHILNFILLYSLIFMSFSKKSFSFYFLIVIVFFIIFMLTYFEDKKASTDQSILNHNISIAAIFLFLSSITYIFQIILSHQISINFISLLSYTILLLSFLIQIRLIYMLYVDTMQKSRMQN
ncbi:MAG TPA: hypothetical protein DHV28_00875 [Ignavibacteriales bacterium]|nr:hypothetical protein [Ignavibacteriales bacterium]